MANQPPPGGGARPKGAHGGDRKMFFRFPLTQDAETAKFLPFNEAVYPRLGDKLIKHANAREAKAELDNMWMVGFVDHEQMTRDKRVFNSLGKYMDLPHGYLGPAVSEELRKLRTNPAPPLADDRQQNPGHVSAGVVKMSDEDVARLNALGREALAANKAKKKERAALLKHGPGSSKSGKAAAAAAAASKPKRSNANVGRRAYERENRKILALKHSKRPQGYRQMVQSQAMDQLFELERQHTEASLVLQRAWRHYLAGKFWSGYMVKVNAALIIQRVGRGMVVRLMLPLWFARFNYLVGICQGVARGHIFRRVYRYQRKWEYYNCSLIQAGCRGFIGRKVCRDLQVGVAARHIQALWRGCVGRARADKAFLNRIIVCVQKLVRGFLGRARMGNKRENMCWGALVIQRYWRGSSNRVGRGRRNRLMNEREGASRQALLDVLAVEAEWWADERERLQRRRDGKKYPERIKALSRELRTLHDEIHQHEYDYLDLDEQRHMLSPRAIEQTWAAEIDRDLDQHWAWITTKKNRALFEVGLKLRTLEEENAHWEARIEEAGYQVREIERWRTAELNDMFARASAYRWGSMGQIEARKRVADQKRRWEVRYFTAAGKPDKLRRPGRPWDKAVLAGPEKATFSFLDDDILAGTTAAKKPLIGSAASLDQMAKDLTHANVKSSVRRAVGGGGGGGSLALSLSRSLALSLSRCVTAAAGRPRTAHSIAYPFPLRAAILATLATADPAMRLATRAAHPQDGRRAPRQEVRAHQGPAGDLVAEVAARAARAREAVAHGARQQGEGGRDPRRQGGEDREGEGAEARGEGDQEPPAPLQAAHLQHPVAAAGRAREGEVQARGGQGQQDAIQQAAADHAPRASSKTPRLMTKRLLTTIAAITAVRRKLKNKTLGVF